jgi:2-polyprenyl-6-methoxyphenol hydroxylase-like FAD-dependent oxidoreductase
LPGACSLAGLTQDDAGVEAIFEDGRRLRAKYAVGADGMHSKVRELARIGFSGKSYGQSFLLADVRLSGGVPNDQVVLYFSPAGLVVAAPLPDGVHRIVATVDEALPVPSTADVQALLDARGPATDRARVAGVLWGSRFRVHCRIADRYRAVVALGRTRFGRAGGQRSLDIILNSNAQLKQSFEYRP